MRKRSSKKKSSDPNVIAFEGMQSLLEKLDPESVTPAMESKVTDHIWTWRELLGVEI